MTGPTPLRPGQPRRRARRALATALAAVVVALLALGGCAAPEAPAGPSEGTIGLLLPEAKTARYETSDRPTFVGVVEQRCPTCEVLYANAAQDAANQQQQAESMLARGADVLVLDAVDAVAAVSIVAEAQRLGVPVIAYDRFVDGADYYVSFDNELIGYLMGEALVGAVLDRAEQDPPPDGRRPGVLFVQGSPTDPNAAEYAAGAHRAFDGEDIDVLAEYDTPDWSPDKATEWVEGQLTQYAGRVDGVFAASDGIAGGAIAAMKAAGLDPVPPTTGQDGELAAVQRIVSGDQYMTVYKATAQQARTAAELAVRVLRGEDPRATASIDGVPSLLLAPRAVGIDDVQRVIVDGGVHTVDEICTPYYVDACVEAGLLEAAP
ncbi:substrate-binding domain-containing protein [Cellulosimicrobium cellulans]|uniref:substrate-binding domain-containing protein n=1 Tax=Cellulosimicrobium cellulans TaxID=1710 RepID=UPI0019655EA2|nr:substrate-binding domain-containing protein [Cellulosimicrobium cellulans]MBN0039161.1 substrate-binding domain-containing protein [Cellulosimicrobium cellulans]